MVISIAALLLIAFLPAHPRWYDIAWRMALCGAGFGIFLSPNARLIIGSAAARTSRRRGRADLDHPPGRPDDRAPRWSRRCSRSGSAAA